MRIFNRLKATFFLCIWVVAVFAQSQSSYEKTQIDGKDFYIYHVNQAEGFYSLTQQFHVSQAEIEKYNPETKDGLKKGQSILIPVNSLNKKDGKPVTTVHQQSDDYFVHTVMTGETLSSIARMYNITVNDIIAQNPELSTTLVPGQRLTIPQPSSIYRNNGQYKYHTIQPKETLFSVAKQYGVSMQSVVNENPGLTNTTFSVGRIIRIKTPDKTDIQDDKQQTMPTTVYLVHKKETLYSISRKLNIPLTQLLELNPNITHIKTGDKLIVPQSKMMKKEDENPALATQQMHDILDDVSKITSQGSANVAVILPFDIQSSGTQIKQNRYIEFYEGFLLAVDSIRSNGTSIDIHIFDSQVEGIKSILKNPELAKVDLIIGPANADEIKLVSDFAKSHQINMVNPFTFDSEATNDNPYLFQVNTPNSYLYAETASEFIQIFKKNKIVFINKIGEQSDKKDFINYLRNELDTQSIAYEDFEYSDETELSEVDSLLNLNGDVVFVPLSSKKESLNMTTTALHIMHRNNTEIRISLFGYPEWQMYTNEFGQYFYELNTYLYTRIYINPFASETKGFYNRFKYWYHKDLLPIYPRYGVLGFDTGMFFLQAVSKYGKRFDTHIDMISAESLQTAMCFRRINNWSGFINRCLYFVNFRPNNTIHKIEVK